VWVQRPASPAACGRAPPAAFDTPAGHSASLRHLRYSIHCPFRPFCSKRCQLIDLGEWAAEEKRIPSSGDLSESDDWSEELER